MLAAVFSDIHANIEALNAVLADAHAHGAEHKLCLGDSIGFNGDPAACLDTVMEQFDICVRGNHEQALIQRGLFGVPLYTAMMDRTAAMLTAEHLSFIRALPAQAEWNGCSLVHASPHEPETWQRISNIPTARKAFAQMPGKICFFGHTHRAAVFKKEGNSISILPAVYNEEGSCVLPLEPECEYLINPGAVGQPRDLDWRAAYALLDTEAATLTLRRVEYDVKSAAEKICYTGLPESFANALLKGVTPTGD